MKNKQTAPGSRIPYGYIIEELHKIGRKRTGGVLSVLCLN